MRGAREAKDSRRPNLNTITRARRQSTIRLDTQMRHGYPHGHITARRHAARHTPPRSPQHTKHNIKTRTVSATKRRSPLVFSLSPDIFDSHHSLALSASASLPYPLLSRLRAPIHDTPRSHSVKVGAPRGSLLLLLLLHNQKPHYSPLAYAKTTMTRPVCLLPLALARGARRLRLVVVIILSVILLPILLSS